MHMSLCNFMHKKYIKIQYNNHIKIYEIQQLDEK